MIVSLADTLALAVCIKYSKTGKSSLFFRVWLTFLVCNLPGLFVGDLFMPAFFYLFSLIKAVVYFQACYVIMSRDRIDDLVKGLAISVIANGIVTIGNSLQGQTQAAGLIGHRNYAGMVCNMVIPVLLVAGTRGRFYALPIIAVLLSAVAAALGGSRAVLLLLGVSVFGTIVGSIWVKSSKQNKTMLALCLLGSVFVVPLAIETLSSRFSESGGSFSLTLDEERQAFERAAENMTRDYPLGVGANQYAVVSNTRGYAAAAGVTWRTLSALATVHNGYVLVRTEGGIIALVGMLLLFSSTFTTAYIYSLRRRTNPARVFAVPVLVTTGIFAIHLRYEWGFVNIVALYNLAFTTSLVAYVRESARKAERQARVTVRALDRSLPFDQAVHQP